MVLVKYEGGAISCHAGRRASAMGYDQRAEVTCTDGSLVSVENPRASSCTVSSGSKSDFSFAPIAYTFEDRYASAYAAEVEHFVEQMSRGALPKNTCSDSYIVCCICDAANESAKTGKRILLK